ncbi:hypothetical protein F511_12540 [Dorcoceras hygrometricum]|uniref:Transmembrane protein n=1 Tax=Dorcoceras hygrometricum TaxID=472368 RepID=A0A2Z7DFX9_9LAMI|nr:hypothetical protein F511_12540 [Dorcoceras hygrometricum]
MAFRNTTYWKSMVKELRGRSSFATSAKAFADSPHLVQSSPGFIKSKLPKGDFIPVCVALGMDNSVGGFGVYTALHQLGRAPNVSGRKSRRETVPEVAEPENVAEAAEKFVKQSFFRKVAHIQGSDRQEVMSNPIGGDALARLPKGDFIPVCVALGMITLSASFGVYTALHQLGRAPNVSVRKSRRETVPEVAEPENVAEAAEKFVKQSFFRKVAHIQGSDRQEVMSNPIGGDALARPMGGK